MRKLMTYSQSDPKVPWKIFGIGGTNPIQSKGYKESQELKTDWWKVFVSWNYMQLPMVWG